MIKLEKVNKYFNRRRKNEIHIIQDTSLELEDKGLVAILGQSGSGKTTLLNVIGGLDKVNKGNIYINGEKITRRRVGTVDRIRNLNIGYVFQDYKLLDNMTVFDNVAIALRMIGIKNKKEIQKRVNYVLEAVGMIRYRNRLATMLSGGEKQRVAIARALVKNPSIVIADEPTGNLDSRNSLEIMNIIKAISKEKLVILVTHEVELANFYATRIVEVQDGKVTKDYPNENADTLEYRLDNKIYLQDMEESKCNANGKIELALYTEPNTENMQITIAIKNNNLYIQAKDRKVEVVDEDSAMELVNSHYQKIDKSIYEKYTYDLNAVSDQKYTPKYRSIYGLWKSIQIGFKRILNYSVIKKILLLGFFASAMFIVYSVTNVAGIQDVRESDYQKEDKHYVQVSETRVSVDEFNKFEEMENIDYILPGDGKVSFKLKMDTYYQLSQYTFELPGTLIALDKIQAEDIILGRMPENEYEIVLDKKILTDLINDPSTMFRNMGIKHESDLLNQIVRVNAMPDFRIVGFVDLLSPSIYADRSVFINLMNNMEKANYGTYWEDPNKAEVLDYELLLDDIKVTKGRLPENDYEVIINKSNQGIQKLNKTLKEVKVNEKELKVVGFYESKTNRQDYLVNASTIRDNVISKNTGAMVYTEDKEGVVNTLRYEYGKNAKDCYERDKTAYLEAKKEEMRSAIIFAAIIFAVSLVEIYLMIRSSFLSRIKEIGVYRAIGVKKTDIYRMFMGEILAITTVASLPGIALMAYILTQVVQISYVSRMFIVNGATIGLSLAIIYGFNLFVGLAPLYRILRKTPASILARHDVE